MAGGLGGWVAGELAGWVGWLGWLAGGWVGLACATRRGWLVVLALVASYNTCSDQSIGRQKKI